MSGMKLLVATFKHLKKPYQLLIIPLTFWSGIEQGFFGADFTAVSCSWAGTIAEITTSPFCSSLEKYILLYLWSVN